MSSGEWLSDLAKDDPVGIMHHCQIMMDSHINQDVFEFEDIFQSSDGIFDTNKNSALNKNNDIESVIKAKITPNSIDHSWSSSGNLICFGSTDNIETKPKLNNVSKRVGSISNQEHVVAERKRREKMIQGFVALAALIPGLKKTDKASILAETAEYLKQLEERAKFLEEQTTKRTIESVCLVKKIQRQTFDDATATSYSYHQNSNKTMNPDDNLEIEVKVLNNNIFIRVHSLNIQGLFQKILQEIGNLNFTILNCQTMPFGSYAVNITIIAKASDDFNMSTKELVKHLGNALQHIISQNL